MYKKYILKVFFLFSFTISLVVVVNYTVDPLWFFTHKNLFNRKQIAFNEKRQKTNYITFNGLDADILISGTSRTKTINQNDFKPYKTYNYAVAGTSLTENKEYIKYAKKINKRPFKYIVLELYVSSDTEVLDNREMPSSYINEANGLFYRIKTLLSLDTLIFSLRNAKLSLLGDTQNELFYNRENVEFPNNTNFDRKKVEILYNKINDNSACNYNENYTKLLYKIKTENSDSIILPIIPPLSAPSIVYHMKSKSYQDFYRRWLKEVISVFGAVYDFNRVNSVTSCLDNYRDTHHIMPHVGTMIAGRIMENITGKRAEGG